MTDRDDDELSVWDLLADGAVSCELTLFELVVTVIELFNELGTPIELDGTDVEGIDEN